MVTIVVLAIIFGSIASVIILPLYFRSQERIRMQEVFRAAIERGEPLPKEMTEAVSRNVRLPPPPPSPSRDLRTGLVWVGIAVGLASMGFALSFESPDALFPLLGCAAFPLFIGVAFIIMWAVARDKK